VGNVKRYLLMAGALGLCLLAETAGAFPHGEDGLEEDHAAAFAIEPREPVVLDLKNLPKLDWLVDAVTDQQLLFVGEIHDRYDHHLNQLTLIQGLHGRHPDLVIGLEFFQQPFQKHLDDFVAGQISEAELLRETEYFDRWRFDYRLYRPILQYAREHKIPVIALNVPSELSDKVAEGGLDALDQEERAYVSDGVERENPAYASRLREIYAQHPRTEGRTFDSFLDAQLFWDEGMAQRAADYFRAHPDGHMVVLAGAGHLEHKYGIPDRVSRRVPVSSAVALNGPRTDLDPAAADYLILSPKQELPRSGMLGVFLDTSNAGVSVTGFADESPAKEAGLRKGDRILEIAGHPVAAYADVRIALLDRAPGDAVSVDVERENLFLDDEHLRFDVVLH